ncbi:hypothetical protein Tco_0623861 [Tanacetum coccineum]|uniref:CCHC-type domain-containing protein n=1 Tax=Tanacetum coccineum TaxID=301880 RepID=A0ABQ4WC81_9ASTR
MSSMQEDIQCAGSDTRPPMLDRTDFESWQQRIRLYCLGKDNGENIMKSIKEGPFQMGTVSDVITGGTEGAVQQGPVRARVLNDLSAEEKERYKADIRATNILLQGIPKDIYSLINHYTDAKDIWENVKMILEGSELTKDDRESQLYDEFEHFRQIKGETIQGYYVRFTKLINDMRNIKMTMSRMQLNSKFVNNMLPEWSRFITEVKLNRGLKESNCDQLYAYLKQHEVHANENRIMMERFGQPNNDPLALELRTEEAMDNLWSCETIKCYNCNGLGLHRHRECPSRPKHSDSATFKDKMLLMQAQENGAVLDEEQSSFLAGEQVTNVDDDVDDSPENDLALIYHMDEYHDVHEMQNDVQHNYVVDSDADYTSDSNIIPYDQYVEDNEEHVVQISTVDHYKSKTEEVKLLKKDFKQKEDKFLEEFFDLKKIKDKIEDRLYKQGQSAQTVHMLCQPKSFYDEKHKVAIGYKKQAQSAVYNGHMPVTTNHTPTVIHDSEDTRELAEITRKRMLLKMQSPLCVENKIRISPPDYSKENLLATFAPQRNLTPEQIFWSIDDNRKKAETLAHTISTLDSILKADVLKVMMIQTYFKTRIGNTKLPIKSINICQESFDNKSHKASQEDLIQSFFLKSRTRNIRFRKGIIVIGQLKDLVTIVNDRSLERSSYRSLLCIWTRLLQTNDEESFQSSWNFVEKVHRGNFVDSDLKWPSESIHALFVILLVQISSKVVVVWKHFCTRYDDENVEVSSICLLSKPSKSNHGCGIVV